MQRVVVVSDNSYSSIQLIFSTICIKVLPFVVSLFRSRMSLQLKILALRHQLTLYQRSEPATAGAR